MQKQNEKLSQEESAKRWFEKCGIFLLGIIAIIIVLFYIFDPYFHYHKPFSFVSYRLYD